jgi:hypothetical protein
MVLCVLCVLRQPMGACSEFPRECGCCCCSARSPENVAVAMRCERGNVLVSIGSGGVANSRRRGALSASRHQDSVKGRANFENPRITGHDEPQRSIFFQGGQEKLLSRVTSVELIKGAGSAGGVFGLGIPISRDRALTKGGAFRVIVCQIAWVWQGSACPGRCDGRPDGTLQGVLAGACRKTAWKRRGRA